MTQVRLYSDLHLEFGRADVKEWISALPKPPADSAVVLAGDITAASLLRKHLGLLCQHFADSHVLYVPGNHEYFGHGFDEVDDIISQAEADNDNLTHLTVGVATTIGEQRFVGHTLWYPTTDRVERFLLNAQFGGVTWSDFRHIKNPRDIVARAEQAAVWLRSAIQPTDIVVTHMLPSHDVVTPQWIGNEDNCFFVHDIGLPAAQAPRAWLFGHTHDSQCITLPDCPTEYHCNPCGYWPKRFNPDFDREGIVGTFPA